VWGLNRALTLKFFNYLEGFALMMTTIVIITTSVNIATINCCGGMRLYKSFSALLCLK
jgi:hypothetical protein